MALGIQIKKKGVHILMAVIDFEEKAKLKAERKYPVIQLYSQVVDGMEFYILMDTTNRCLLDKWLMEHALSMELMRHDLRVIGIGV